MSGKIDCFIDCGYALLYLLKNRKALESRGVEIEFHPVFLGGINVGSGNKPPWTLPAKARYSEYDGKRAQRYFGVTFTTPKFFPILSLLPQRCMAYIKSAYPRDVYEAVFRSLFTSMWQDGNDLSKPDKMAATLSRHFSSADEVKAILDAANSPEFKQKLNANTQRALDNGAFGCPWFVVTNSKGVSEPFFGSDRFAYMWSFLEIPFQDIAIVEKAKI